MLLDVNTLTRVCRLHMHKQMQGAEFPGDVILGLHQRLARYVYSYSLARRAAHDVQQPYRIALSRLKALQHQSHT